eukprot:gene23394-29610_t
MIVVLNVLCVVGVNILYVWVTINSNSLALITVVEVAVAAFKLVWNDFAIPCMFRFAAPNKTNTQHKHLFYRVCIVLFNNIVAPCAATAAVSPNCFYYLLTAPDTVTSTATIEICIQLNIDGSCSAC